MQAFINPKGRIVDVFPGPPIVLRAGRSLVRVSPPRVSGGARMQAFIDPKGRIMDVFPGPPIFMLRATEV